MLNDSSSPKAIITAECSEIVTHSRFGHNTRNLQMNQERRFNEAKLREILENTKEIYYKELLNGNYVKRYLNFDSPRTKEAALQIGITYEDCIMK